MSDRAKLELINAMVCNYYECCESNKETDYGMLAMLVVCIDTVINYKEGEEKCSI